MKWYDGMDDQDQWLTCGLQWLVRFQLRGIFIDLLFAVTLNIRAIYKFVSYLFDNGENRRK